MLFICGFLHLVFYVVVKHWTLMFRLPTLTLEREEQFHFRNRESKAQSSSIPSARNIAYRIKLGFKFTTREARVHVPPSSTPLCKENGAEPGDRALGRSSTLNGWPHSGGMTVSGMDMAYKNQ